MQTSWFWKKGILFWSNFSLLNHYKGFQWNLPPEFHDNSACQQHFLGLHLHYQNNFLFTFLTSSTQATINSHINLKSVTYISCFLHITQKHFQRWPPCHMLILLVFNRTIPFFHNRILSNWMNEMKLYNDFHIYFIK